MITTFNTAVTETASKVLGKRHHKKKKNWVTAEILDLCDKRRELKKKREEDSNLKISEIQGSEQQHQEVHEKGKRKLDWRTV